MYATFREKEQYCELMNYVKHENIELKKMYSSRIYRTGKIFTIMRGIFNSAGRKAAKKYYKNWNEQRKLKKKFSAVSKTFSYITSPNYFSNDRIAIYTCIIGKYDALVEPGLMPDNCDYYIITDQPVPCDTKWEKIDITKYRDVISGLTNAEINRFFKMKPDLVFPDYKYSIYLDGNIKPVSDLTEFINLIGPTGIAAHNHSIRNDVYEEAEVLKFLKRDKPERIDRHIGYLKSTGMPENYGLIECNVIAREHNNPTCKKIMDEWWEEFRNYSKRDQISFIHVLYMNGIDSKEIGTLGDNVFDNPAIRKVGHS